MSASLRFVLPMPENIANGAHGHWRARYEAKKDYWELLDGMCSAKPCKMRGVEYHVPLPPKAPLGKARIRSTMHLGGAMDDSNAMRRHKWIEDYLKTRGYIVDDRKKCLTWEGFPDQIVKRDGKYRVEITLTAA